MLRTSRAQIDDFEYALAATFVLLLRSPSSARWRSRCASACGRLRDLQEGVAAIRRGEAERIGGDFPPDIAPLAAEVNLLLDANREVVERARTQVGNLAHALKTPLSVIVNEADAGSPTLAEKVKEQADDHAPPGDLLSRPRARGRPRRLASARRPRSSP